MLSLFNGLPFEVQVSQGFNDGNPDFTWARGAVITSPEKGLWDPCGQVTEEDVRHMRNRFVPFRCHAVVARLADSNPCAAHLCKWLVDGAAAADARAALRPGPAPRVGDASDGEGHGGLGGMGSIAKAAKLPAAKADMLTAEIVALGAVDARELAVTDWQELRGWAALLPFERKRLLAALKLTPFR